MLRQFGMPATFFLTTEALERRRVFWWDLLQRTFLSDRELPASMTIRIAGGAQTFSSRHENDCRAAHDQLYGILKGSLPAIRDDVMTQLQGVTGILDVEGERPIDVHEVRALSVVAGVEIGGHTVHHASLPAVSREHLFREVSECRSALLRLTSRPVTAFAYPFGDLSPACVEMVSAAGFQIAVTCESRRLRRYEHALRLPRIQAPAGDGDELMRVLWSPG